MKILMANYRYFISSGPEKYMFNVKKVFEENWHKVVPFPTKSKRNIPTEHSDFFVEPLEAFFHESHRPDLEITLGASIG